MPGFSRRGVNDSEQWYAPVSVAFMGRFARFSLVAFAAACARSGIQLTDDGDGLARGGSTASGGGGIGGSSTGGDVATGGVGNVSAGAGGVGAARSGGSGGSGGRRMEPPFDPGGPIPNCRADAPVTATPKDNHWLYVQARLSGQSGGARFLVELKPNGPQNITYVDYDGELWGWSPNGRFLAIQGADRPHPFTIFDVTPGGPFRVDLPSRGGFLEWSHAARYALDPDPTSALPSQLVIADPATATERIIDLPERHITLESWSPDDRYVALAGAGLVLVDTTGAELELSIVYQGNADRVLWSDDSRYVAFQSMLSGGDASTLFVFDTLSGQLKIVDAAWLPSLFYAWAGDGALVVERLGGLSTYVDVTQSVDSVVLAQSGARRPNGAISPGGKCYVYEGFCDAAREEGICVRALPPDPQKPAVLIQRFDGNDWQKLWAGSGDQLLFHSEAEPWLVHVALDGEPLTRRFVADGTSTTGVDAVFGWSPTGRSDWLGYLAGPSPGHESPRLWHRATGASHDLSLGNDDAAGWAWSPDGRYFVVQSEPDSGDGAFFVQEVLEEGLGTNWRIEELVPSAGDSLQPYYVQP